MSPPEMTGMLALVMSVMSQFDTLATAEAARRGKGLIVADGLADGAEAIPLADALADGLAEAVAATDAEAPGDELPAAG